MSEDAAYFEQATTNMKESGFLQSPTSTIEAEMNPENEGSIDVWYRQMLDTKIQSGVARKIFAHLKAEEPNVTSVTFERFCNLQCTHCVYQPEKSTKGLSVEHKLEAMVENIVRQMPTEKDGPHFEPPVFVHEGRILLPWHIAVMKKLRVLRPDMRIGLIDNGTFKKFLHEFNRGLQLRLDWIDISIDGTEESHNKQRANTGAFATAIEGLQAARSVVKPDGEVNSLMTLTTLNFHDIEKVADLLLTPQPDSGRSHVDVFVVTTMSPARQQHEEIELSRNYKNEDGTLGDVGQVSIAWEQIRRASAKFNTEHERVSFRLYRHQDLEKFAYAIGAKKFWEAFTNDDPEPDENGIIGVAVGRIIIRIDGVSVVFSPLSTWPQETFLIDADASVGFAYSIKHTIQELQAARNTPDENLTVDARLIKKYTLGQLDENSSRKDLYQKGAEQWWENFGKNFLSDELAVFQRIAAQAAREP